MVNLLIVVWGKREGETYLGTSCKSELVENLLASSQKEVKKHFPIVLKNHQIFFYYRLDLIS